MRLPATNWLVWSPWVKSPASVRIVAQHAPVAVQKKPPALTRRNHRYCLSYTAALVTLLPFASVPLAVTVRVLPSADRTIRAVVVTLPSFF